MAGVGNEAVISLDKVVDYIVEDDTTEVIGLLVESVRDPRTCGPPRCGPSTPANRSSR